MPLLKTYVSQARWCSPNGEFNEAKWRLPGPRAQSDAQEIYWLDHILDGGIYLPRDLTEDQREGQNSRALTLLLTGPPGSGKSVLALELCTRWASRKIPNHGSRFEGPLAGADDQGLFSLYISTENSVERLKEKARESFGWNQARIIGFDSERLKDPAVTVLGVDYLDRYLYGPPEEGEKKGKASISGMVHRLLEDWPKKLEEQYRGIVKHPHVLVVDSLNVIESDADRQHLFTEFLAAARSGPALVIFVVESESRDHPSFWEFVCDIVIRMDRRYVAAPDGYKYMLRTFEAVKARNQNHVWGRHQLKIYKHERPEKKPPIPKPDLHEQQQKHPYRVEGGIFIYPSVHYYLSQYKHEVLPGDPKTTTTPISELNAIIGGGLPEGRCTALLGTRSGHKSHFGYFHILNGVLGRPLPKQDEHGQDDHEGADVKYINHVTECVNKSEERGIIVSLRDDTKMARQTMEKILAQQWGLPPDNLSQLEEKGKLEILYYPPGYIAPEEFFHRLFTVIRRMKDGREGGTKSQPVTLLFNSLDQLQARFPLCAQEPMFVPSLINVLNAEQVTSLFVAVAESDQPEQQYGLLPMADLILSASRRQFRLTDYQQVFPDWSPQVPKDAFSTKDTDPQVVLEVSRMPGGQNAGARGFLDLVDTEEKKSASPHRTVGMHFTPINVRFPRGKPVEQS